jgi:signal transduction histidine kinase
MPTTWRTRAIEWATIFAVWSLLAALFIGRTLLDPDRVIRGTEIGTTQVMARLSIFAMWALFTPFVLWLSSRAGTRSAAPLWQRTLWHVAAAIGVSVAMDAYGDVIYRYVLQAGSHAVDTPWPAVQASFQDALTLGFIYELIIYLGILAVGFARAYYRRLQQRQMQAAQLRAQLTEARLQALRMQINPHFLFNTLNTVSGLVERDPPGARTMLARLSGLLRHTLSNESQQLVPLHQEMAMLRDYLDIMRVRFEDRLRVEMEVDDAVRDARVPDLILQPLVENAIKHGVRPRETPGRVRIEAARIGDSVRIRVEDDGPGLQGDGAPNGITEGVGLRNVRERLQRIYGDAHRMTLSPAEGGGLRVELRFPYRTEAAAPDLPESPADNKAADAPASSLLDSETQSPASHA